MPVKLHAHQEVAVEKMHNGCVLYGGVGVGKTITSLGYYFTKVCGGEIGKWGSMQTPKDVYVITTAKVRDTQGFELQASEFGIHQDPEVSTNGVKIVVDSWNNLHKYTEVKDAFFVFDEQRVVGYGAWSRAFIKVARANEWILLSATPGDTWMDYIPVFIANGWYRNKTDFVDQHVIWTPRVKYPKVLRYQNVGALVRRRNQVLVHMPYDRHTVRHAIDIWCDYDQDQFEKAVKKRWHVFEKRPLRDVAELFIVMRRIVNSDASRLTTVSSLLEKHPKLIVFYNFDYELEMLRELGTSLSQSDSTLSTNSSTLPSRKSSSGESTSKTTTDATDCPSTLPRPSRKTVGSELENQSDTSTKSERLTKESSSTSPSSTTTTHTSKATESKSRPTCSPRESKTTQSEITPTTLGSTWKDASLEEEERSLTTSDSESQTASSTANTTPTSTSSGPTSTTPSTDCLTPQTHDRSAQPTRLSTGKETNPLSCDAECNGHWTVDRGNGERFLTCQEFTQALQTSSGSLKATSTSDSQTSSDTGSTPTGSFGFAGLKVLNAKQVGKKTDDNKVYVGRPSKWGNPFVIGEDGSREEVILKHREYIQTSDLLDHLHELKGKDLVCWCAPEPCHAEVLLELANKPTFAMAEWNGHKHQEIPKTDRWLYLVQYRAGAEGWNCIETDAMAFFSQTYSYRDWWQAHGRIDRINTPFTDLWYYHLVSRSLIDKAIRKALKVKKNFNERDLGL